MTALDLDAIKARFAAAEAAITEEGSSYTRVIAELTGCATYLPALVAEVERQAAEIESLRATETRIHRERDALERRITAALAVPAFIDVGMYRSALVAALARPESSDSSSTGGEL